MDLTQYIGLYLQEMRDNLAQLNRHVVQLEREPGNVPLLQEIMRLSHSSKGSSNAMGFKSTADLFHALEDVFDAARKGKLTVTREDITNCLKAFDCIDASFTSIEKTKNEQDCTAMATIIRSIVAKQPTSAAVTAVASVPSSTTSVLPEVSTIDFIRVGTEKIEKLTDLAGEFSLLRQRTASLKNHSVLAPIVEQLDKLVDDLTYYASSIRLVPLEQAFARFPRLVRDLATSQGKNIRFEMTGTDVELDKTLVDHLVSPLIHLLRNAVDHGIESPGDRAKQRKSAEGVIRLVVEREGGFARVTVEDDGEPIALETLKAIAKAKGIDEGMLAGINEGNILDLLCLPGFSSAKEVTEISGRGVGLSAVLQAAKALGGEFTLMRTDEGKRFTISLPLQLSIIQSLLIEDGGQTYALPIVHVRRLLTVPIDELKSTLGQRAAVIDHQDVPLIFLQTLFGSSGPSTDSHSSVTQAHLVLVEAGHGLIGIVVDRIAGSADIMVKPIAESLKHDVCFTGSTILGSGRVALILDVPGIVQQHTQCLKNPHLSIPLNA